jgi:hypothetical protein
MKREYQKLILTVFLSLAIPLTRIPGRRILLQSLWQDTKIVQTAKPSSSPSDLRKVPRNFRPCKPCTIIKKSFLAPPVQSATLPIIMCNGRAQYYFLSLLFLPIDPPLYASSPPARSPPASL